MIDFQNGGYFKLSAIPVEQVEAELSPLMLDGERMFMAFKGLRDYVVFTDKRIIAVNAQGLRGKKRDYSSLPYKKVQAFSVETAGTFDLDAELELWFSGLGRVKFEFSQQTDVAYLNKLIGSYVL